MVHQKSCTTKGDDDFFSPFFYTVSYSFSHLSSGEAGFFWSINSTSTSHQQFFFHETFRIYQSIIESARNLSSSTLTQVWSTMDGRSWHRLGDGGFLARMDFGLAASKAEIYLAGGASCSKTALFHQTKNGRLALRDKKMCSYYVGCLVILKHVVINKLTLEM